MKKMILFIIPILSMIILYQINQRLQQQALVGQEWEQKAEQLNSLATLTQNYFMMRIETLQIITPLSSADVKKGAEHNRANFNYEASRNYEALSKGAVSSEEKQLLQDMIQKLGVMREIMDKATVQNAQKSINEMIINRIPYREAASRYAAYLGKMRKISKDEMTVAQKSMQNKIKILFVLQFVGIGAGVFYVRSVRS